jgi:ribulose-5-phosphate 4-epimerase/fuculose-1-phosphate aldolase
VSAEPPEHDPRVDLAAAYRLFDFLGWVEGIDDAITLRVPGSERLILTKPFGVHASEVTAENAIEVDLDDIDSMQRTVYAAAPQARCIMHVHTTAALAVASSQRGLTPTSNYSASVMRAIAYRVEDLAERRILIIRNDGLLVHGPTVPDAFIVLYRVLGACEFQVATNAIDDGLALSPELLARTVDVTLNPAQTHVRAEGRRVPALARRLFDTMSRVADGDGSAAPRNMPR